MLDFIMPHGLRLGPGMVVVVLGPDWLPLAGFVSRGCSDVGASSWNFPNMGRRTTLPIFLPLSGFVSVDITIDNRCYTISFIINPVLVIE